MHRFLCQPNTSVIDRYTDNQQVRSNYWSGYIGGKTCVAGVQPFYPISLIKKYTVCFTCPDIKRDMKHTFVNIIRHKTRLLQANSTIFLYFCCYGKYQSLSRQTTVVPPKISLRFSPFFYKNRFKFKV